MVDRTDREFFGDDKNLLDDRKTVFDRVEDQVDDEDSSRPIREAVESVTDNIPDGPAGKLGDGDITGYAGYLAIKTGQLAVLPIPGVKQPGFHTISHGAEQMEEFERHTVNINAASRHVAKIAAEYEVAAPSNIDYVTGEIDVVSIEEKKQRSSFSTWEVIVDVADRGQKEF